MAKIINGTEDRDEINQGSDANLTVKSLGGNDQIILDLADEFGGNNTVDSGAGDDKVDTLFEGGNRITLGAGNDGYVGFGASQNGQGDIVNAGSGDDVLLVKTINSLYLGNKGNDLFFTSGHNNTFDGGSGTDTISFAFRQDDQLATSGTLTISLLKGTVRSGSGEDLSVETLKSIENADGSIFADKIFGDNNDNVLRGLAGDDKIQGLGGNDTIVGGAGIDKMFGGDGADIFKFVSIDDLSSNGDVIADFSSAEGDKIDLSEIQDLNFIGASAFTGLGFEVRFDNGVLEIDANGDGTRDGIINVDVAKLSVGDLTL